MSKDDGAVKEVLEMAFKKYRGGAEKHGEIDLDTDPRNFVRESINELLDSIVYNCFEVARLQRLDAKLTEGAKKLLDEKEGGR